MSPDCLDKCVCVFVCMYVFFSISLFSYSLEMHPLCVALKEVPEEELPLAVAVSHAGERCIISLKFSFLRICQVYHVLLFLIGSTQQL